MIKLFIFSVLLVSLSLKANNQLPLNIEVKNILSKSVSFDFYEAHSFLAPENNVVDLREKLINFYNAVIINKRICPIVMFESFHGCATPSKYYNTLVTERFVIDIKYLLVSQKYQFAITAVDSQFLKNLKKAISELPQKNVVYFIIPQKKDSMTQEAKELIDTIKYEKRSYVITHWKNNSCLLYAAPNIPPHAELPLYGELLKGYSVINTISKEIQKTPNVYHWSSDLKFKSLQPYIINLSQGFNENFKV